MSTSTHPWSAWFATVLLLVGSAGVAAAWTLLAYSDGRQYSWMAVVAAIDAAVLLRLARVPSGWGRAGGAVAATLLTMALANWSIAATQMGRLVGLLPWEAMLRLGASHAWTLAGLANPLPQLAWLLLAVVVAFVAAR